MFVDQVRIFAKAGDGGGGASSFRRESFVPRGGPDGGDGGHGGGVVLKVDPHTDSLVALYYEPLVRAPDGVRGKGKKKYGKSALPRIIPVPRGTMVFRLPPGETISARPPRDGYDEPEGARPAAPAPRTDEWELVADLAQPDQEFVLCRGGEGGRGNVHFKSPRNQAPTRADPGEPGEEGYFYLELRHIADAGFVGYPNAGKSTLLGALSSAKPKVAAYPFTTLHPLIGMVDFPDSYERLTLADIPGLIEGAHRNVGLGHEFLRHILRCRLLLFVLDMSGQEGRHPLEDLASLRRELSLYNSKLSDRPWLIVANKMDLPESAAHLRELQSRFPKVTILPVSGEHGEGLDDMRITLRERLLANLANSEPPDASSGQI